MKRRGALFRRLTPLLGILLTCLAAGPVHATCAGPTGNETDIIYNGAYHTYQFCNGTSWMPFGAIGTAAVPSSGTPSGLSFTNLTGQSLNTLVASNVATVSGFTGTDVASVTGASSAQISINGGGWVTSGGIQSGQTIQVRLTTSASGSTMLTASVSVGSTSASWQVTTAGLDACTGTTSSPSVGAVCTDGSIYAGVTPDGNVEMYAAPCDAGMTGSAGSCTGTRLSEGWGGFTDMTNVTSQTTGKANTATEHGNDSDGYGPYSAADYCYNLSGYLGHSDWYLPAEGELNVMYINMTAITGFTASIYWSSSETTGNSALNQDFSSGAQSGNNKFNGSYERCTRHN